MGDIRDGPDRRKGRADKRPEQAGETDSGQDEERGRSHAQFGDANLHGACLVAGGSSLAPGRVRCRGQHEARRSARRFAYEGGHFIES